MDPFEDFFDRFDRVARKNVERWKGAADKLQSGVYKADDYVADVVGGWYDATLGLLSDEEPVVQIRLVKGINSAQGTVRLPEPAPAGTLTASDLPRVKSGKNPVLTPTDPILQSWVKPELSADRKTLGVTIINLASLVSEAGAIYVGSVDIGSTIIAKVRAVVKK